MDQRFGAGDMDAWAATISSGVSGNGLKSLSSTGIVIAAPWFASGTMSSFAVGTGRVDAVTVIWTRPVIGSVSPSSIVICTVPFVPLAVSASARARRV